MSNNISISLTAQQAALAQRLVDERHYESISAVVQRGIELVEDEDWTQAKADETLRTLLEEWAKDPPIHRTHQRHALG